MMSKLHALVISSSVTALRHIQSAFSASPAISLSLHTDWSLANGSVLPPNVLILCADMPIHYLRQLRLRGYDQPALILVEDAHKPAIAPLEDDLRPLENVTWAVVHAGGLPKCVEMMVMPILG